MRTQGEWKVTNERVWCGIQTIADCCYTQTHKEGKANAQYIVQCVNSHEELTIALETIVDNYTEAGEIGLKVDGVMENAVAALKKARGEA